MNKFNRYNKKPLYKGFTLIELVIFITISSILIVGIFVAMNQSLLNTANRNYWHQSYELAQQCMEYLTAMRRLNGYSHISVGTSNYIQPFCDVNQGGAITSVTINSVVYKVMTTKQYGDVTLQTLIANY